MPPAQAQEGRQTTGGTGGGDCTKPTSVAKGIQILAPTGPVQAQMRQTKEAKEDCTSQGGFEKKSSATLEGLV